MPLPRREPAKPLLENLLLLWHGDAETTGWASPTLARAIAHQVKPVNARALAEAIYYWKDEDGRHMIPIDRELHTIVKQGFDLYRK